MTRVTSEDLKTLAMSWCRFYKRLDLICSEDPIRSADVLATDSSIQCRTMIEIETKISIADLKADLKKTCRSRSVVSNKHERLTMALKKHELIFENFNGYTNSLGEKIKHGPDKCQVHGVDWDDKDHSCLPTQFYFMVPENLKDKALPIVNEMFPHCGLMVGKIFTTGFFRPQYVSVIKRAPVLHKRLISKSFKNQILARATSELCSLRLDNMRVKWSNVKYEECKNTPIQDPET